MCVYIYIDQTKLPIYFPQTPQTPCISREDKPIDSPQTTCGPPSFRTNVCSRIDSSNDSSKMKRTDVTSLKSAVRVSRIAPYCAWAPRSRPLFMKRGPLDAIIAGAPPLIRATTPLRGSLVRNRAESLPIIMPILSPVCDRCSYCSRRYDDPSETCVGSYTCVHTRLWMCVCVCVEIRPQTIAAYAASTPTIPPPFTCLAARMDESVLSVQVFLHFP